METAGGKKGIAHRQEVAVAQVRLLI